jgi:hypothetical protein
MSFYENRQQLLYNDDKRMHHRVLMTTLAKLLGHDATPKPITTIDISVAGLGILSDGPMTAGANCIIAFDLPLFEMSSRVNIWTKVAYCVGYAVDKFRVGVSFRDADAHSKFLIKKYCESRVVAR